jgi:hypothetical protein
MTKKELIYRAIKICLEKRDFDACLKLIQNHSNDLKDEAKVLRDRIMKIST